MTDVSFDRFLEVLLKTNGLSAKLVDRKTLIIYPETPAKASEYRDLQIRTFYLSNLDVKKAVTLLTKVLKNKDITANEKLNAVVIRGPREVIDIAAKVIEANDRPPAEVLLNVEILEVKRDKERQLGLDVNPMSATLGVGESQSDIDAGASFVDLASLSALGGISTKELLLSVPTVTLNFLKQDADTVTLANPQIRVKNGEKAKIHIGERVPLRVNRRIDTTGVVTNDFEYTDIGVRLEAEPVINLHDEITLKMNLEVSVLGPNLGSTEDPQFPILTRNANTVLTVRDGEPVILGGLISDAERSTVRKIPGLGDIPAVGNIFSNLDERAEKTDILMAITPVVVRSFEIPGTDVTRIWSGHEHDFSLREPYESYIDRKEAFTNSPRVAPKKHEGVSPETPPFDLEPPEPMEPEIPDDEEVPPPIPKSSIDSGGKANRLEAKPKAQEPDFQSSKNTTKGNVVETNLKVPSVIRPEESPSGITDELWPITMPYSIHVGSYRDPNKAQMLIRDLTLLDYDCFMVPTNIEGKGFFYRIFIGKFKDFPSAQAFCEDLRRREEFAKDIHVVSRRWASGG
jgi:general secretion pathway protein D